MPDLRKDPIVGRWVIIAESRADRPNAFTRSQALSRAEICPFCPGNEHHTPAEVLAYREPGTQPNGEGWRVRAVPNKFPALQAEGDLKQYSEGMYSAMRAVGVHEVIIESAQHVASTSDLTENNVCEVLFCYRDRMLDLQRNPRLKHAVVFKNVGAAAGASLDHTHSQLVAMPMVPIDVHNEISGSLQYFKSRQQCVFCDMLLQELTTERRVVLETQHFVAFCPFASRFPFETWIVPKEHTSRYEVITPTAIDDLARVLRDVIRRIETAADRPAYNYIVHTAPFNSRELVHFHWYLEILPRLTNIAGFELGAGYYINPVPPEEAADMLRNVEAERFRS